MRPHEDYYYHSCGYKANNARAHTPHRYWHDYPGRQLDLFACDEHAFCHACAAGNAYCEAVAYHYGGVGVPYWVASGVTYTYSSGGNIGANAAFHVLNKDLAFWCAGATLARVANGTFTSRGAPLGVSPRLMAGAAPPRPPS